MIKKFVKFPKVKYALVDIVILEVLINWRELYVKLPVTVIGVVVFIEEFVRKYTDPPNVTGPIHIEFPSKVVLDKLEKEFCALNIELE